MHNSMTPEKNMLPVDKRLHYRSWDSAYYINTRSVEGLKTPFILWMLSTRLTRRIKPLFHFSDEENGYHAKASDIYCLI